MGVTGTLDETDTETTTEVMIADTMTGISRYAFLL